MPLLKTKQSSIKSALTMVRGGIFHLAAFGGRTDLDVKYNTIIKCGAATDRRGFLFDQVMVDNYFQSLKRTDLSCEQFTMQCANELAARIREENPKVDVRSFELTLTPAPFASSITYAWKRSHQ